MPREHSRSPTYVLHAPVRETIIVHVEQESILDGWLREFDAKQAALDARQDAFFERLGIRVVSESDREARTVVDAEFEEKA